MHVSKSMCSVCNLIKVRYGSARRVTAGKQESRKAGRRMPAGCQDCLQPRHSFSRRRLIGGEPLKLELSPWRATRRSSVGWHDCWVRRPRVDHVTSSRIWRLILFFANAAKAMQVIQRGKPELICSDLFGQKCGGGSSSCGDARG